jgi:ubiquinone/menaquinone biosynthesis C-methylase UbiE
MKRIDMKTCIYPGDSQELQLENYSFSAGQGVRSLKSKIGNLITSLQALPLFLRIGLRHYFNTVTFSQKADYIYKLETIKNWTSAPCGSCYSSLEAYTKSYFAEIEEHRYRTHPWILKAIHRFDIKGKRVLEIGYGMGTDHRSLASLGGVMSGIDLTPLNKEVASKHLELYGYSSDLKTGDAERLPYPDQYFDFVYSFGVIHHSPNTAQVVREIRRVLRPGGKCYVTVYHKNSIFFWWSVYFLNYVLSGNWRKRTLRQQISLIEYPNNNETMVIRLYKKSEFLDLFKDFVSAKAEIEHLLPADISLVEFFYRQATVPTPFLTRLGKYFGWYVVVEAEK